MEILPFPKYKGVLFTVSKMTSYSLWRIWLFKILPLLPVGPQLPT